MTLLLTITLDAFHHVICRPTPPINFQPPMIAATPHAYNRPHVRSYAAAVGRSPDSDGDCRSLLDDEANVKYTTGETGETSGISSLWLYIKRRRSMKKDYDYDNPSRLF